VGVVIAHGEHDGTRTVDVPAGMQVEFFAYEDSPLPMVILIELLKRGDKAFPLETAKAGTPVHNYLYKPFKQYQIDGVKTVKRDWKDTLLIGDAGEPNELFLCSNPAQCEQRGRHDQCGGVFGRAVQRNWTRLQIVCCRTNTTIEEPKETKVIKGADGREDASFYETFRLNGMNFVAKTPAEQDKAWESWSQDTQTYQMAIAEDMKEWADCYTARREIDKRKDRAAKADVIGDLPAAVTVQLLRDYPAYGPAAAMIYTLNPTNKATMESFLRKDYVKQEAEWFGMAQANQAQLLPWLTDPRIASWARLCNTSLYATYGLRGKPLVAKLMQLEPAQRKIIIGGMSVVRDEVAVHAPELLKI
jgi:hypothetical protein